MQQTLSQSIDSLTKQLEALDTAHKKFAETPEFKDEYFRSVETTFATSAETLTIMLGLMGYSVHQTKSVYDHGLEIGVLSSTRNWAKLINMRDSLTEDDSDAAEAIEFFENDFKRIIKPTFKELESKAKDYVFFQKNKKK